MSVTRFVRIPFDHVMAEMAAFPLASESALRLGPVALNAQMGGGTGRLWEEAETAFVTMFPSFLLDELVALRDRVWFSERTPVARPLHRYLRQLARWYLEPNGAVAIPRLPAEEQLPGQNHQAHTAIARRAWLWLSFALPPDLLLAGLHDGQRGPEEIALISPPLDRLLRERGYAETHLHVGAALDFRLLWTLAMNAVADPALRANAFRSPGAALNGGQDLAPWLIRAALARYVLAAYLTSPRTHNFNDYLQTWFYQRVAPMVGATGFTHLLLALSELEAGHLDAAQQDFAVLQGIYAQLTGVRTVRIPPQFSAALQCDPINVFWATGRAQGTPETRFVSESLRFLEQAEQMDNHFATLFWQGIRVRNLFYRHVVQRPMTPGLQWFVRFYGRSRPARTVLPVATLLDSAAEQGGFRHGLESLEIRTAPDPTIREIQKYVSDLEGLIQRFSRVNGEPDTNALGDLARRKTPEIGLVYHFIKRRGGGAEEGIPRANWLGSNADPRVNERGQGNPTGYRYARFYKQRREEAQSLSWLLCHRPLSLFIVRGLDVCTDELGVPNWVMAPLLERVRRAASDGASALPRFNITPPPPLRTTIHAGEDFVHLLTGLRMVDEAVEFFGLREGDRIGHGVALGVEPRDWARHAGRIVLSQEERLFDLLWEWQWYSQQGGNLGHARGLFLLSEIARLSNIIFDRPLQPYELLTLKQDLYSEGGLHTVGFPDGPLLPRDQGSPRQQLLRQYLTDSSVFDAGRVLMWIDPSDEGEILAALQAGVRQKLGARGIAVEVNPTSNLLIGDLGDLTSHPLWRLRPPRGDGDAPPVSICIGSDDPLVFGSNLRHEYQFISDALALAGLSDEEARQWLDRVRECGLEHRFTLQRPDVPRLLGIANYIRPQPLLI